MLNKRRIFLACTDTPSWDDGDGETCPDYRTNYCFDNIASVAGPFWNYPELNCCGCGKVEKIRGICSRLVNEFIYKYIKQLLTYTTSTCLFVKDSCWDISSNVAQTDVRPS